MQFTEYFNNLSAEEKRLLSEKLDISVDYLRHIALGYRKAGPGTMLKVKAARMSFLLKQMRPDLY